MSLTIGMARTVQDLKFINLKLMKGNALIAWKTFLLWIKTPKVKKASQAVCLGLAVIAVFLTVYISSPTAEVYKSVSADRVIGVRTSAGESKDPAVVKEVLQGKYEVVWVP